MTAAKMPSGVAVRLLLAVCWVTAAPAASQQTLAEQNGRLLEALRASEDLGQAQLESLREIFNRSGFIGQGNPTITRHPMSREECDAAARKRGESFERPGFREICGSRYMAPLYDPEAESPTQAKACIDQFEFPNLPCEYPVVWVRAREAAEICRVLGKRLCDAHEWEGACAGALRDPDYRFDLAAGVSPEVAVRRMREAHNAEHGASKTWSYGPDYRTGVCAASSVKSATCDGGGWRSCGSNTFPAGAFPDCKSPLGVYDLNGNAAEHMNLPLSPEQMSSRGSLELGVTEMKGSWFIFDSYRAHEDWCRWRAPYWHGSRVMDANSHHNYHLGFRCCKTLEPGGE
jgi:formylglycine-generating enzyme required for sulfatase activity